MSTTMDPFAVIARAGELDLEGKWLEAIALLRRLLDDPALDASEDAEWIRAAANLHLGNALTTANDPAGAMAAYEACIAHATADPDDVDTDNLASAYFNMGAALEKWNRLEEALEAFRASDRAQRDAGTRAAIARVRVRLMRRR